MCSFTMYNTCKYCKKYPTLYNDCIFYDGYHLSKIFASNDTIMTTTLTVFIGVICRAIFYGLYANRLVIKIRDAYL